MTSAGDPPEPPVADDELPPVPPAIPGAVPTRPRTGSHRRPHRRWRTAVVAVVGVAVLILVAGFLWVQHEANPSGPHGAQVIATVGSGTGADQLAGTLESKGVIGSSLAYRIWSQFHTAPAVAPGSYAFSKNSSFSTVDQVLAAGPNVFPIDVPPGFTVAEVALRVGQLPGHTEAGFDAVATGGAVRSPWQPAGSDNLDGLLGTGLYVVVPGETDTQLLTAMIDRFDRLADDVDLEAGAARLGYSPYQVITMASIVEKEGVIAKNLGPVARVILNRLANDMPLQMDSTVLYAEGRDGGTVTAGDLAVHSPYNTYLNKGLTPTPICFPSRASLEAALHPPSGSWLYFVVVQSDGTEAFADTFAEQQANEALAQQRGLG
ncbi:MAG: endolytic transglycosylase MltG [Acidimicrobiales bacterium]|jgi:UPF0755 protein